MVFYDKQTVKFEISDKKECVVPEIKVDTSKHPDHEFKFFVVRKVNAKGEPTGLYLKDVNRFRDEKQNSFSKYKFQRLYPNDSLHNLMTDKTLVRLKPGDNILSDMPETSHNREEYASFDDLLLPDVELSAVIVNKNYNGPYNPSDSELFIFYTNQAGERRKIKPNQTHGSFMYFKEIQEELDKLVLTIPENDFKKTYDVAIQKQGDETYTALFNGVIPREMHGLECSIKESTLEKQNTLEVVVNIVDLGTSMTFKISNPKDQKLNLRNAMLKHSVNDIHVESYAHFHDLFLDPNCKIPIPNLVNADNKIYLFCKDTHISKARVCFVSDCGYGTRCKFFFNKGKNYEVPIKEFKDFIISTTGLERGDIKVTDRDDKNVEVIGLKDMLSKKINVRFGYDQEIKIDGKPYTFRFSPAAQGYATEITDLVNSQKANNQVISFAHLKDKVSDKYFYPVQYEEGRIFLRLKDIKKYRQLSGKEFVTAKTTYSRNYLNVLVADKTTKKILGKHKYDCDIKYIFAGGECLWGSEYHNWYSTKIKLNEIAAKFGGTLDTDLSYASVANEKSSTAGTGDLITTSNIPNYRFRHNFVFLNKQFFIPKEITNLAGQELAFSDLTLSDKNNLIIYIKK